MKIAASRIHKKWIPAQALPIAGGFPYPIHQARTLLFVVSDVGSVCDIQIVIVRTAQGVVINIDALSSGPIRPDDVVDQFRVRGVVKRHPSLFISVKRAVLDRDVIGIRVDAFVVVGANQAVLNCHMVSRVVNHDAGRTVVANIYPAQAAIIPGHIDPIVCSRDLHPNFRLVGMLCAPHRRDGHIVGRNTPPPFPLRGIAPIYVHPIRRRLKPHRVSA